MPGRSLTRRLMLVFTFFRTCVRHGYMLPVVSKLNTTSTKATQHLPQKWGLSVTQISVRLRAVSRLDLENSMKTTLILLALAVPTLAYAEVPSQADLSACIGNKKSWTPS